MAYAFRCKTCRRLVTSADAGELETPTACPSCGSGVSYDPKTGLRTFNPDNWEKLAELPEKEQKALADDHGVAVDELIEEHVPAEPVPVDREPVDHVRTATENLTSEDRP